MKKAIDNLRNSYVYKKLMYRQLNDENENLTLTSINAKTLDPKEPAEMQIVSTSNSSTEDLIKTFADATTQTIEEQAEINVQSNIKILVNKNVQTILKSYKIYNLRKR